MISPTPDTSVVRCRPPVGARSRLSRLSPVLLSGLVLSTSNCGGLRAASSLASQDAAWQKLTIGKQVTIYADGACNERFSANRAELQAGGGVSLGAAAWAQSAATYTIEESYGAEAKPGDKSGGVYLKLSGNGQNTWVHTERGFSCVFPVAPELTTAVLAEKGQSYAFTPWLPACKQITGAGKGFSQAALSLDVPPATVVDSVRLTQAGIRYSLGNGLYVVDKPTLESCFGKPGATPRSEFDYLANLKIEPSRCEVSTFQGKTLVECRSTVGLWKASETGLTLSRRTLGPVFFLDGRPVSGGRFARNVVSVTTASPQNDRERALYKGIDGAVARAVSAADDSVRVAPPGDPAISRTVRISIADVTIGDLQRRETFETSKFKVREGTAANPDKAEARTKMEELERKYADAKSRCARGAAGSDCNAKLRDIDKLMQAAREAFAKIPASVTTTVTGDWKYKKTTYARSVSATIATETTAVLGKTSRSDDKISFEVSDYEVVADPEHNVPGHTARREIIESPEAVLSSIADKAGETAATALRRALQKGALDSAIKAFAKAGGSSRPGYETVDAAAFDAVGERLLVGEAAGEGTGVISAPDLKLTPADCLLVAAVATTETGKVGLSAGIYADERGKGVATLEICQSELGAEPLPTITLSGAGRWAIYKTHSVAEEPPPH